MHACRSGDGSHATITVSLSRFDVHLQIKRDIEDLCRTLGAESVALVEAFGIPEHLLAAPIASDWVTYNAVDNQGELTGSLW